VVKKLIRPGSPTLAGACVDGVASISADAAAPTSVPIGCGGIKERESGSKDIAASADPREHSSRGSWPQPPRRPDALRARRPDSLTAMGRGKIMTAMRMAMERR